MLVRSLPYSTVFAFCVARLAR